MNNAMTSDPFFREYTSQDAIRKYSKATAGYGISYLLEHDYKRVYLEALRSLPEDVHRRGVRILEFGCGAGMNLVHLISILKREGIKVQSAIGTDFSPVLIDAARNEASSYLSKEDQNRVEFYVGKNETLIDDLSKSLGKSRNELLGSFDFILGVNTFRYCHRASAEYDCAKHVYDLLIPGGISVMIDMNDRFLFFRSSWKEGISKQKEKGGDSYIPSLDEYATPFAKAGFQTLRRGYFCWIPHSAGPFMCGILGVLSPLLNVVANSRAMRSLVVGKKPRKNP